MCDMTGYANHVGMTNPRLRQGRHSQVGQVYALTTVAYRRQPLFTHPDNVEQIIGALRFIEAERITCSLAWVVMPDHLHWLMQLRQRTLPACMQLFKSRSARLLNRALSRSGPIWQPGFYDHAVRSDESLHAQALYIVANPVRAGLATRLGEYPYAWCRWPLDG